MAFGIFWVSEIMSPFDVWSKVCMALLHVRSNSVHCSLPCLERICSHMKGSNADFAPHMEQSNADFNQHMEQRHSFKEQKLLKIGASSYFSK